MSALERIERLLLALVTAISNHTFLPLYVPKPTAIDAIELDADHDSSLDNYRKRDLASSESALKYAQIVAICSICAEVLSAGKTISQRDVYYSLKNMFKTQQECNAMILEVGLLLGMKRYELGIVPTSRGYVAGDLIFKFVEEDAWVNCNTVTASGGVSISSQWRSSVHVEILSNATYLLVIEKEGIYHRLCEDLLHTRLPCIILREGFPDISSRALVHTLANAIPDLRVLGVCDYNPYGLALLLTFKVLPDLCISVTHNQCGSASMSYEGAGLTVPALHWLGLRPSPILTSLPASSRQPFTRHDINKCQALIQHCYQHNLEQYAYDLEVMQQGGFKCELEALFSFGFQAVEEYIMSNL